MGKPKYSSSKHQAGDNFLCVCVCVCIVALMSVVSGSLPEVCSGEVVFLLSLRQQVSRGRARDGGGRSRGCCTGQGF